MFSGSRIGSTNTFTISGIFSNTTSQYTSANSATGDIVQVQSGSRFYWLHIYSIASNAGGVITCNVRDSSSTLITFPLGNWNIFRPTPNLRLPLSPDGESNASRSATFNTLALRVDEIESNTGLQDGDKGDVRVTNSAATWTIDNNAVTSIKIAHQTVDSLDLKNRSITTVKVQDNAITTAKVASNQINRTKLTPTLRDSLTRFRKDTLIRKTTDGNLNLASSANALGRYNRVHILVLGSTGFSQSVTMPSGADTLENTEFNITYISQDTTSNCLIAAFDGFAVYYAPPNIDPSFTVRTLASGNSVSLKPVIVNGTWSWLSAVSKNIYNSFFEEAPGMTALTGDVTATGTGSVTATIATSAVTSSKILDGTIVSADIASQTVDSLDLKNRSVTTVKLLDGAVTSLKVLDNSLTGSDLTYLTLRAGTISNASLQLTSGSDKTPLTGGEVLYNGSRFAVGIGSTKRRVAVMNDVTPSNGQLPIGNGTDFTVAGITAGNQITVTNGSGSITIATYPKRDTTVAYDNVDYNLLSSGLTSTQVNTRFNNIWITGRVPSSGVGSDALLLLPSPSVDYNQVTIHLFALDQNATYNIGVSAPTNSVMLGNGTYTNAYPTTVVAGQTVRIRCVIDPADSNNYKWIFP